MMLSRSAPSRPACSEYRIYSTVLYCRVAYSPSAINSAVYSLLPLSHHMNSDHSLRSLSIPIPPGHPYHLKTNLICWSSGQQSQSQLASIAPSTIPQTAHLIRFTTKARLPPTNAKGPLYREKSRGEHTQRQVQQPFQFARCDSTTPTAHTSYANSTNIPPLTPIPA